MILFASRLFAFIFASFAVINAQNDVTYPWGGSETLFNIQDRAPEMIGYERWLENGGNPHHLTDQVNRRVENKVKAGAFKASGKSKNQVSRAKAKKQHLPAPLTAKQRSRIEEKRRSKLMKKHLAGKRFQQAGRRSTGAYKRTPKKIPAGKLNDATSYDY